MFNHLRQSTASQTRSVGPFVDDTDFKTIEDGLTIANTDVKLSKNGAAGTNKNSGGGTHTNNGMYSLTFDATDTDTVGELTGSILISGALVVPFKFQVLEEAVYDAMYASAAPGYLQPTTAGRTLDIAATGEVGLDFDNVRTPPLPVTLTNVRVPNVTLVDTTTDVTNPVNVNLATGSDSVSITISSTEATTPAVVGTPTNTYTATAQEDGTYHSWIPSAGTLEFAYNANIGANSAPTKFTWIGYVTSINDTVGVFARNWVGGTWEQIGTINGTVAATIQTLQFNFTTAHVDTGANSGNVRVRFYSTGATVVTGFFTDRALVSYTITNQSVGYAEGALWYDNNATANTNTTPLVDAAADNPVTSWAAIKTLIASTGIKKVHIGNGATVTLDANSDGYTLYGNNWTLALGGQSIEGISVSGAEITGIGTATVTQPHFANCFIGAVTLPPCTLTQCGIGQSSGTFTAGSAGDYTMHHCFSMVPGSGSPAFAFSGLGATTGINNRAWTGGATWTLDSDCTLSHEVLAGGGTTITTGGGNVEIRGIIRSLTLTMSAAETVQFIGVTGPITLNGTTTATVNLYGVSGTLTDNTSAATVTDKTVNQANINTEVDTGLTDYDGPTNAEMEARTLPAANYFDPAADIVANVTLVDTCATNSDMRGTDGANTVVPDAAGTAAALHATTDGLITTVDTIVDAIKAVTDKVSGMLVIDGAVYQFTANSLELAPGGGGGGGDATLANQTLILTGLTDIKGTGFVKDTNSLVNVTGSAPVNWTIGATIVT